jgi:SP family general alpha glucoside:H+ symporter-like MFS transporter
MATTPSVQVNPNQKAVDHDLEEKLGQNALAQAKQATDDEHAQTLMQAIKQNRKAVLWSVLISLSIVMEGYVFLSSHLLNYNASLRLEDSYANAD